MEATSLSEAGMGLHRALGQQGNKKGWGIQVQTPGESTPVVLSGDVSSNAM